MNVTSSSTQIGSARMCHYAASKGGLAIFTKSLAAEFARHGITANNVPPNFIDTPMLREYFDDDFITKRAAESVMGPPRRRGVTSPRLISYLCSVAAKHINGHTLSVNGGQLHELRPDPQLASRDRVRGWTAEGRRSNARKRGKWGPRARRRWAVARDRFLAGTARVSASRKRAPALVRPRSRA